jgi:hypothetical protein
MEMSNTYEKMPRDFQRLVPKGHLDLKRLMDYYTRFIVRNLKPQDHSERAYKYVFRLNIENRRFIPEIFGQDGCRCDICFQPMKSKERHIVVHLDITS